MKKFKETKENLKLFIYCSKTFHFYTGKNTIFSNYKNINILIYYQKNLL